MSASDPEQWSDSDYSALSRAIWRESENTKNRVRTGPAAAVLGLVERFDIEPFSDFSANEQTL